jgi:sugar phosphate isomerase/epimerase
MNKIGVADYGLDVWFGGNYDYTDRLAMLKELGFDGIERLKVRSASEAMSIRADAKKMGMDFAVCEGAFPYETIRWSSALDMEYVWTAPSPIPPIDKKDFYRQVNKQIETCEKYGLKVALHNHLGLVIESQDDIIEYLKECPKGYLLLDTGHLIGAGGSPEQLIESFFDRIVAVHLKDFVYKDKDNEIWHKRLRFCELGAGEIGDRNKTILHILCEAGYKGWLFVEHDTHMVNAEKELKISLDYIKENYK